MNDQPHPTTIKQTKNRTTTNLDSTALLEALRAIQHEAAQHTNTSVPHSPLATLAELLNDLTRDGLLVWWDKEGWRWLWSGTELCAPMNRLGLGDAVADAVAAKYPQNF